MIWHIGTILFGHLRQVPAWIWVALALSAVWYLDRTAHGNSRYADGRDAVVADLRKAETKAKKNAWEAVTTEGAKGALRAREFEAQQNALLDAIRKAEADDANALDGLF
jgi:hypothetical protein